MEMQGWAHPLPPASQASGSVTKLSPTRGANPSVSTLGSATRWVQGYKGAEHNPSLAWGRLPSRCPVQPLALPLIL